jgi:hypothetical protein
MFKCDMGKERYFSIEEKFEEILFERYGKLYSKTQVQTHLKITPELLLEKEFRLEFADIVELDNEFRFFDAIFENKSGFFLYLSRKDIIELNYRVKIYFEPEKLNEVNFFIKNLIRLKDKNGN